MASFEAREDASFGIRPRVRRDTIVWKMSASLMTHEMTRRWTSRRKKLNLFSNAPLTLRKKAISAMSRVLRDTSVTTAISASLKASTAHPDSRTMDKATASWINVRLV